MKRKRTMQEKQAEHLTKLNAEKKQENKNDVFYGILSVFLLYVFCHGWLLKDDTIVGFLFMAKWSVLVLVGILLLLGVILKMNPLRLLFSGFDMIQIGFVITILVGLFIGMSLLWVNYLPFEQNYETKKIAVKKWSIHSQSKGRSDYSAAQIEYLGHKKELPFYSQIVPKTTDSITIVVRTGNLGYGYLKDYYVGISED